MWEVAGRLAEYEEGAELDIHIDSSYKPLRVTKGTLIKAVEEKKREKEAEQEKLLEELHNWRLAICSRPRNASAR
jgi:hypothetical protein